MSKRIELSANDPFLNYLGFMYNKGIDYIEQSEKILKNMDDYKTKLDTYMKNTKLDFLLNDKD